MRPNDTDREACMVCRSVCHTSEAFKKRLIEMPFGLRTGVGPRYRLDLLDGVHIPTGRGNFEGATHFK